MPDERLIEALAYNLYRATIVGDPAPFVRELGTRMANPQPGDLVLETTTLRRPNSYGARLGRLLRIVDEPFPDWPDDEGDAPLERVWYITLPDGREYRWTNASFIAVPTEIIETLPFTFVSKPAEVSHA
jgi:hypothetical protein